MALHPQLEADSLALGAFPLCAARLMNNRLFPWVLLIPQGEGLREITDLAAPQRSQLMEEIATVSSAMQLLFKADKMNVAALGNMVPQLHVHVIARFTHDSAWPNPVWGRGGEPYGELEAEERLAQLRQALKL